MQIIAHNIENIEEAEKATKNGADLLEIDVSQRILFSKFTTQHNGVLGKFGIGKPLESLLISKFKNKLFLDLKHPRVSHNYTEELIKLLKENNIKGIRMVADEWHIVIELCRQTDSIPFLALDSKQDLEALKEFTPRVLGSFGISLSQALASKTVVDQVRQNYPTAQLWVWTVNDARDAKRITKLEVDGVITDKPKTISSIL